MAKRTTEKKDSAAVSIPAGLVKKPKQKGSPKAKRRGLTNAGLRELMKTHKPPQSWYDEDFTGVF